MKLIEAKHRKKEGDWVDMIRAENLKIFSQLPLAICDGFLLVYFTFFHLTFDGNRIRCR